MGSTPLGPDIDADTDTAQLALTYADRPLLLKPEARIVDGMYFYQGLIRQTRRIINNQNKSYLDLHPAEELLLELFDGQHTLNDMNKTSREIQQAIETGQRMPLRNGLDLVVQLDNIGVLA